MTDATEETKHVQKRRKSLDDTDFRRIAWLHSKHLLSCAQIAIRLNIGYSQVVRAVRYGPFGKEGKGGSWKYCRDLENLRHDSRHFDSLRLLIESFWDGPARSDTDLKSVQRLVRSLNSEDLSTLIGWIAVELERVYSEPFLAAFPKSDKPQLEVAMTQQQFFEWTVSQLNYQRA